MFVKDGCFFLTKWHFWHTKSCLFIAFVNLPFSSVGRAECKDGSQQELWKSKKLEKKLEKLRKEYNPQNEMFAHFQTKRIIFKNETQLFKVIPIPQKSQKIDRLRRNFIHLKAVRTPS